MPLLKRIGVLLAKAETTPGTDAAPTGTDGACNFYDVEVQPNIAMVERVGQGGFGRFASVPGAYGATVTFRTYLEWDGTATEPFWADVLLPACGWVKSTNTFTPRSEAPGTNVKTLTFYHYLNGKLRKILGAAGDFVVTLPTGQPAYIDWTFTGVWAGETDASIVSPTYPADTTLRFAEGLAELSDVNLCVSQATINAGNNVILRECPTTAAGYISAIITDRAPTVTLDPESVLVATRDAYGDWIAMAQGTLELDLGGPGNSVLSFDAPKAQITNAQNGDRNMLAIDTLTLLCGKNGATHDQELSIVFTPAT